MFLLNHTPISPHGFESDFAWGALTHFYRILQRHSQGALPTYVNNLVIGLDAALFTSRGAWHHLLDINSLPLAANASC